MPQCISNNGIVAININFFILSLIRYVNLIWFAINYEGRLVVNGYQNLVKDKHF